MRNIYRLCQSDPPSQITVTTFTTISFDARHFLQFSAHASQKANRTKSKRKKKKKITNVYFLAVGGKNLFLSDTLKCTMSRNTLSLAWPLSFGENFSTAVSLLQLVLYLNRSFFPSNSKARNREIRNKKKKIKKVKRGERKKACMCLYILYDNTSWLEDRNVCKRRSIKRQSKNIKNTYIKEISINSDSRCGFARSTLAIGLIQLHTGRDGGKSYRK